MIVSSHHGALSKFTTCSVTLLFVCLPACRFYSELIKFRRQHPLLGRGEFLTNQVGRGRHRVCPGMHGLFAAA